MASSSETSAQEKLQRLHEVSDLLFSRANESRLNTCLVLAAQPAGPACAEGVQAVQRELKQEEVRRSSLEREQRDLRSQLALQAARARASLHELGVPRKLMVYVPHEDLITAEPLIRTWARTRRTTVRELGTHEVGRLIAIAGSRGPAGTAKLLENMTRVPPQLMTSVHDLSAIGRESTIHEHSFDNAERFKANTQHQPSLRDALFLANLPGDALEPFMRWVQAVDTEVGIAWTHPPARGQDSVQRLYEVYKGPDQSRVLRGAKIIVEHLGGPFPPSWLGSAHKMGGLGDGVARAFAEFWQHAEFDRTSDSFNQVNRNLHILLKQPANVGVREVARLALDSIGKVRSQLGGRTLEGNEFNALLTHMKEDLTLSAAHWGNSLPQVPTGTQLKDLYTLSRLGGATLDRESLVIRILDTIRPGVDRAYNARDSEQFGDHHDSLSTPELLKIDVLLRGLHREDVLSKLSQVANLDKHDPTTELGGEVLLTHDSVAFHDVPPTVRGNNGRYEFPEKLRPLESLALFHFHALQDDNAYYAGPSQGDLETASDTHSDHVVVTLLPGGKLNVDFVTINGLVVDLGVYTPPIAEGAQLAWGGGVSR